MSFVDRLIQGFSLGTQTGQMSNQRFAQREADREREEAEAKENEWKAMIADLWVKENAPQPLEGEIPEAEGAALENLAGQIGGFADLFKGGGQAQEPQPRKSAGEFFGSLTQPTQAPTATAQAPGAESVIRQFLGAEAEPEDSEGRIIQYLVSEYQAGNMTPEQLLRAVMTFGLSMVPEPEPEVEPDTLDMEQLGMLMDLMGAGRDYGVPIQDVREELPAYGLDEADFEAEFKYIGRHPDVVSETMYPAPVEPTSAEQWGTYFADPTARKGAIQTAISLNNGDVNQAFTMLQGSPQGQDITLEEVQAELSVMTAGQRRGGGGGGRARTPGVTAIWQIPDEDRTRILSQIQAELDASDLTFTSTQMNSAVVAQYNAELAEDAPVLPGVEGAWPPAEEQEEISQRDVALWWGGLTLDEQQEWAGKYGEIGDPDPPDAIKGYAYEDMMVESSKKIATTLQEMFNKYMAGATPLSIKNYLLKMIDSNMLTQEEADQIGDALADALGL